MMSRAFCGGKLKGDKLVRFAYLDESGIGDSKAEPFVLVAGVIVHADRQIKAIEQYLSDMVEDVIRPEDRKNFVFHAKHLWSGGGILDRQKYPRDYRYAVLQELCEIPSKFDLPVVMGAVSRREFHAEISRGAMSRHEATAITQATAASACLMGIERYMREISENEVAALVYENNDHAKALIRDTQRLLKNPAFINDVSPEMVSPTWGKYLPLSRVVEAPLFSEKNESSILQVADAVVWALNRKMRNAEQCDRFFGPIDSH